MACPRNQATYIDKRTPDPLVSLVKLLPFFILHRTGSTFTSHTRVDLVITISGGSEESLIIALKDMFFFANYFGDDQEVPEKSVVSQTRLKSKMLPLNTQTR